MKHATSNHSLPSLVMTIVLSLALMAMLAVVIWQIVDQPVRFDGAMNLQVAWALSEGDGYARFYDYWHYFPEEVQTNFAFIVPASLIFWLFGISFLTAQLTSILYLVALCVSVAWLIRPIAGINAGLLGAVMLMISPDLIRFGVNGYGEVPALFWALTGLGFLFRSIVIEKKSLLVLAGLCLGTAVLTKTVMLMPVGVILFVFIAQSWWDKKWSPPIFTLLGIAIVIAVNEAWKLWTFGSMEAWLGWWSSQSSAVAAQAGVSAGFSDTPGLFGKLLLHAESLAKFIGLPVMLLPVFTLVPVAAILSGFKQYQSEPYCKACFLVLISIALCIIAYFCWWLFITPTEKAWHRRIFNGLLMLAILSPMVIGFLKSTDWKARFWISGMTAVVIFVLFVSGLKNIDWFPLSDENRESVVQVSDFVQHASDNSRFYGHGWYSAPVLSLYSGQHVFDLNKRKYSLDFLNYEHYFLVHGSAWSREEQLKAIEDLGYELVLDAGPLASVVKITSGIIFEEFTAEKMNNAIGFVDFIQESYPGVRGMRPPEGDGWRWVQPVSEIVLSYNGENSFHLEGYLPSLDQFRLIDGERFFVQPAIGECSLEPQEINSQGSFLLVWSLSDCSDLPQGPTIVSFRSNGVMLVSSSLSWIVRQTGFK